MIFHKVCTLEDFHQCACWQCASSGFLYEAPLFGTPNIQIQLHRPSLQSLIPANLKSYVSVPLLFMSDLSLWKYIFRQESLSFICKVFSVTSQSRRSSLPISMLFFHVLSETVPGLDHLSTEWAGDMRVGHMLCFNVPSHVSFLSRHATFNTLQGSFHAHQQILINCTIQFCGNS